MPCGFSSRCMDLMEKKAPSLCHEHISRENFQEKRIYIYIWCRYVCAGETPRKKRTKSSQVGEILFANLTKICFFIQISVAVEEELFLDLKFHTELLYKACNFHVQNSWNFKNVNNLCALRIYFPFPVAKGITHLVMNKGHDITYLNRLYMAFYPTLCTYCGSLTYMQESVVLSNRPTPRCFGWVVVGKQQKGRPMTRVSFIFQHSLYDRWYIAYLKCLYCYINDHIVWRWCYVNVA